MEFIHICGNSYMADLGGTSVCIYMLNRTEAIFVDTGLIHSAELLRALEAKKIRPVAIINTHLHSDHIGNNRALCDRFGCDVYCSQTEIDEERPYCKGFAKKLIANCDEGVLRLEGVNFTIIPTPGHSPGHQAVVTPDRVCCMGDAVMSMTKLKKSKIPYMIDIGQSMESMKRLLETDYPYYIAAHNGMIYGKQIKNTINANMEKELHLQEIIVDVTTNGIPQNVLEEKFMRAAGVTNQATMDFFWMRDTVDARIRELLKRGELNTERHKIFRTKKKVKK